MNSWYVIRIDFGGVKSERGTAPVEEWEKRASEADKQIRVEVSKVVCDFLDQHQDLKEMFHSRLKDCGMEMQELHAGQLISFLAGAIARKNRSDSTRPTLLLLVDEYDKPIREVVFDFIGEPKIPNIKEKMQGAFHHYVAFLDNIKQSNSMRVNVKAWVTGITPVGLTLISGFTYKDLTFKRTMADAVGLLESDVEKMVKEAIPNPSFDDNEQKEVFGTLREQFNNLRFPHGSPLFHTLLMNQAMAELQECTTRDEWLESIEDIQAGEEVPSSAFSVIERAKTNELRAVVSRLVDQETVTGYSVSSDMSLTSLLDQGGLTTGQYLTLLLHLGVVSVTYNGNEAEFKSTSKVYRNKHLVALNHALASSIADLLKLKTKESMYREGRGILLEFLHALSENRMCALIAWAESGKGNRILELQQQGGIVSELYGQFKTALEFVATTQEDKLPSGRSDVSITTADCKVVLELKKKDGASGPTETQWKAYHDQLRGYVADREREEEQSSGSRWVAGFVLVMYNGGKNYAVEKLRNE